MNYEEYLNIVNLESLKILADIHGVDYMSSLAWKGDELNTARAEIYKTLSQKSYLENMINQLDENQKNIVRIIFFSDEAVDQDSVIRKFNNLYGKEHNVRTLIDELWRKGALIKFEMYYRNRPYVALPHEVRQISCRLIVKDFLGEWGGKKLETHISSNPYELSQDIYAFLSYINNNEVRLTAKNVIFRKAAQKIEDLFIAKSDFMDQQENENSERFSLINSFLYMVDMVTYNEGVVYLNGQKVSKWLKLKLMDKLQAVSNFLENYYLGNKREITEAINKIKLILLNTYDTPIRLNHLEETIRKYHADMNFNYLQSNHKRILDNLVLMGLAEYMKDEEGILYFRLNKYGWGFYSNRADMINEEEEEHFYIQPNFELISTVNLNPVLRWELDGFCDISKIEKTIHYLITKASIHRAMSNDKNIEKILTFLKKYSKSGVPQNIEYSLREWASSYGNVYLMDTILLRCRTEELAKEISSIQAISENIVGRITNKDLIINKDYTDDILDVLTKKGYISKPHIMEAVSGQSDDKGKVYRDLENKVDLREDQDNPENIDISIFKIDSRYLDKNAHYKNTVMDIKISAKNEKNRNVASKVYSPSTFQAKEILERAIQQKKPVLIDYYSQMEDTSKRIRIEPVLVQKEDATWTVHANSQDESMIFDIGNIQSIEFWNNN